MWVKLVGEVLNKTCCGISIDSLSNLDEANTSQLDRSASKSTVRANGMVPGTKKDTAKLYPSLAREHQCHMHQ